MYKYFYSSYLQFADLMRLQITGGKPSYTCNSFNVSDGKWDTSTSLIDPLDSQMTSKLVILSILLI